MRLIQTVAICMLAISFCGCGDSPSTGDSSPMFGTGWLGIPSAVKVVVEQINAGTNWILNKNQVSIAKVGDVRVDDSTKTFVADFKIAVHNGTNSFETTAHDVPCDKDGIPTEASITKLREAVEEIKDKIRRLQS